MSEITILYTGDIHARVDQFLRAAYMAEVQRHELKAVGRHTILVDAGDVEDRILIESDLSKGAAMFRLLKAAGYDASAVGNGAALCYGPQVLHDIALASELPLLCANLLTRGPEPGPVPGTQPTLVLSCGPVQVGLVGLTAEINGVYEQFFPVTMPDMFNTARQHVQALRSQGCQIVGALSHLGYELDLQLAEKVPTLDFIIGGHTHTVLKQPANVNDIPVCHAGDYGQFLGRLDLSLDDQGRIQQWNGQLFRVSSQRPKHSTANQVWLTIQEEMRDQFKWPIGHLDAPVDLASDRACGMGQLLADALRVRLNADIALCITGHLQDGLPQGTITLGALVQACRSPANAGMVNLTGAQIIRALEHGADPTVWRDTPPVMRGNTIGILQVSGLTYHLDLTAPAGKRVSDVRHLGQLLDPGGRYLVASTDYELMPPRRYLPDLNPQTVQLDVPWVLREVLQDHLQQFNPLSPGLHPRITLVGKDTDVYIGPAASRKPPTTVRLPPDDTANYIGPAARPNIQPEDAPSPDPHQDKTRPSHPDRS